MIKRSLSWAWFGLAGAAVVVALLVTLLRFGSPWLATLQQQWLDHLLSEHSLTLNIGGLGLDWQDYGPVLVLEEVRLQRPSQPDLTLRRALIDVQLWQSLRQWRPVLNEVTLDGLRLPLRPKENPQGGGTDLETLRTLALQGVERLTLVDAQLVLASPGSPLLELYIPALSWHNRPGLHQGEGRLGFGTGDGQQFVFKGRLEGDIDELSGGIYLQADGVDAGPALARIRPGDERVSAEVSFEAWLEWQQGEPQAALLTLGANRAGWGDSHTIAVNGGRIQWQPTAQGWQLASSNIDISVDGEAWPSWRVQLDRHDDRLSGYLDRLSFTDLALLAQWGEYYWPAAAHQLAGIAPRGRLSGLRFDAGVDGSDWHLDGEFDDVSTRAFGWAPQTQGLNGRFSFAADHGRLTFQQSEPVGWQWDQAFRGTWPIRRLNAALQWQKRAHGWWLWSDRLEVEGDDLSLDAWFSLQLAPEQSPLLSASARVDLHRAGRAGSYLPEPVMGSRLVDYLQGAIRDGHAEHAEVLWYGRLNRFPYHDGSGIFQARVPLRDAEFRFDPHWQPLTDLGLNLLFENDGLYMSGPSGRLGKVQASDIDARIAPLDRSARLALNAGIQGAGEAVTTYLQQSPLAGSVGTTLEQVQVSGPLSGKLALDIPLTGGPVGVHGEVDFAGNEVWVAPLAMPLSEVNGKLVFDEKNTRLQGLQARWLDQPLTVDYQGRVTEAGYRADIGLAGRLQGDALGRAQPWLGGLQGEAGWQGRVQLNMAEGRVNYTAELGSELAGLASRLPPPLGKDAQRERPLRLTLSGDTAQAQARLDMAPDIDAELRLGFDAGGVQIKRLWVNSGGAEARPPRATLDVAAHLAELRLDDWLALRPGHHDQTPAVALHWPERYRVAIRADRGELWRQPLSDLSLTLTPAEAGRHRLAVNARQVKGELAWGNHEPVTARFERLWLAPGPAEGGAASGRIEPSSIPALVFRCDDCRWRDLALGKAGFQLSPLTAENGVQLDDLWLDGPQLQGRAQGRWLQHESGDISRLQWQGGAQSLQALWQAMGETSPFRDTQALLEGELSWPGLPWQPEPATLNGTVSVETGAGVLTELSDRGAGLLSVLSMDSVLRRLRLDFRDVFEEGFYFDSIRATGEFQNGALHNDDFLLKGAAGNLTGRGRVNMATEQLDYRFEFTPNLTGNLPVLAAFAVTPVTGLYVLALSKVLGPVVDVFTRIRYRVSGPLANPKVSELGRERDQIRLLQTNKEQ
ncbi:YhdP family protein [Oceanimonas marisflavi]|uniref:YhdP family protein n=1 Tax=Oceanimonas marisflavi TaxID=2059724 RepID=UPI000D309D20|nr:YhdP family protein [Oceanimonas marisflavi]